MSRRLPREPVRVMIDKLVHGGQAIGRTGDGTTVFVWNALPGETVSARIIRKKRSYMEAIAEVIEQPSPDRLEPREPNYLATSPWQMMTYAAENSAKHSIVQELFGQAHVTVPDFIMQPSEAVWQYRNKMEYSFWGDDDGLHLALHRRGSAGKQIVTGSALALPAVDLAARSVCDTLQSAGIRAGDLKTVVVRADGSGNAAAALFVKTAQFASLPLPPAVKGWRIYYSDPKSPASVTTELLHEQGDVRLHDELLGRRFEYDVDAFFQVNPPVFELALQRLKEQCAGDPTDIYAGVGGIGLSIARQAVTLIESHPATAAMARCNLAASGLNGTVVEAPAERSLRDVPCEEPVIVDPPRAGLHADLVDLFIERQIPQVLYLSCNPATQARDIAALCRHGGYTVDFLEAYNFFPRTPHIETLAVLTSKV